MSLTAVQSADPAPGVIFASKLKDNIGSVVVGKSDTVELMLVALICEGHVLLEDVPGVGKTLLSKALAKSLACSFRRIQFTPDLLPSDITGSLIFNQQTAEFVFREGPIFSQIVLADEINRTTPRTQAALLEAMEEMQVSTDGITRPLKRPFLVLATQNPVELEGTFVLPEAQLDRFMLRLELGYPTAEEEEIIVGRMANFTPLASIESVAGPIDLLQVQHLARQVRVADIVRTYLIEIVRASRKWTGVALGASPRATLALYRGACALACLRGRDYVLPDDIKELAPVVMSHRLILGPDARIKGKNAKDIVADILKKVPVPVEPEEMISVHA